MSELTVILKDSEKMFKQDFMLYDEYTIGGDEIHPIVLECIEEARQNFQGDPETVQLKTHQEL